MASYLPVLTGELPQLRGETEALLCAEPGMIEEQLATWQYKLNRLGYEVNFGAEVESQCHYDPGGSGPRIGYGLRGTTEHYWRTVDAMEGRSGLPDTQYVKGRVIDPASVDRRLLVNAGQYMPWNENPGQLVEDIIEYNTAPADWQESADRYWRLLSVIGRTAADHHSMAMILGTHLNASVITGRNADGPTFLNFHSEEGGPFLLAIQRYLNANYRLQLYAGLESGREVQEAYPIYKCATTTAYLRRLELRNPMTGIIDPRLGMLAVMSAVHAVASGNGPIDRSALRRAYVFGLPDGSPAKPLEELALIDDTSNRLIVPAVLGSGMLPRSEKSLDAAMDALTGGEVTSFKAYGGQVLRTLADAIHVDPADGTLAVRPGSLYSYQMRRVLAGHSARWISRVNRVLPVEIDDSPQSYLRNRQHAVRSSVLRRMLGDAVNHLTPAAEAQERRQAMFDAVFITADNQAQGE